MRRSQQPAATQQPVAAQPDLRPKGQGSPKSFVELKRWKSIYRETTEEGQVWEGTLMGLDWDHEKLDVAEKWSWKYIKQADSDGKGGGKGKGKDNNKQQRKRNDKGDRNRGGKRNDKKGKKTIKKKK